MSYRTSWSPDCKTLVRKRPVRTEKLRLANFSGLEQYQLAPDHHQDSSNGKVVRRIAEFYNEKKETIRISLHFPSTGTNIFEQ